MEVDVLIVGAGPTGLTLACHLLRLGLRVRIIEKKAGFSTTSKAIGLQYRVSEILACMGVIDRFLAKGVSPTVVNIQQRDRVLVQLKFETSANEVGKDAFQPKAIVIPQSETERILGELLTERGGAIEWNCEFIAFQQDVDGVSSRVRVDGTEKIIRSRYLVSCEGAHSAIREQAGLHFVGKTYPLSFFLADVEIKGPLKHGDNYVWMHPDGSFAALPLPQSGAWRLIVDVTRKSPAGDISLDLIRQLAIARTGQTSMEIGNPTWISEFRIHCRMVERFRNGRVFVAGDAAHVHSPTGGQGIVTGIQDATNLAWKLARVLEGAPAQLLDTYEEERKPRAAEVLNETDRTTRLFLAPDPFTRLVRDFVVLPVLRSRWAQRKLFAKLAQLHVNYRESSLSRQESRNSKLRAGDRAPDVAFRVGGSQETITLFQLLEPMRPIVLARVALSEEIRTALANAGIGYRLIIPGGKFPGSLVDYTGDFRRLYGLGGDFLCLIRPDDHVGLIQSPISEPDLRRYLALIS